MTPDEYRAEFAAFNSSLELEHYLYRAGLEAELKLAEIEDRYDDLFSLDTIIDLQSRLEATASVFETERAGLHKLLNAARLGHVQLRARVVTKELANCEESASVEWKGKGIPLGEIPARLSKEPEKVVRDELASRWADRVSICDDLRTARLDVLHNSSSDTLGFATYRGLIAEATSVNFDQLQRATNSLLEDTE